MRKHNNHYCTVLYCTGQLLNNKINTNFHEFRPKDMQQQTFVKSSVYELKASAMNGKSDNNA